MPSFPGASERSREAFAREEGLTACAFCSWTFKGPFEEGQRQAAAHRARKHPQAVESGARRRGGRQKRTR